MEYICYQWYSIAILTILSLILLFLITILMVLITVLHNKALKCLGFVYCNKPVMLSMYWPNNCIYSGIFDNIDSNTSANLQILGWISMRLVA